MKVNTSRSGDHIIYLPSDANRDLGIFLIFIGIVIVPPCYWLYMYYTQKVFQGWRPSIFIAAIWVCLGLILIIFSRKKIHVNKNFIRISDGLFKSAFTIRWKEHPRIRLKYDEVELRGRLKEIWDTSLTDGKLEYDIDRREYHQTEARALGEHIAKFLASPLIEYDEDNNETVIEPQDLDLPFKARVIKYPGFQSKPVDPPKNPNLKIVERNKSLTVSWGIHTTGLLLDIIGFAAIILVFAYFPVKQGAESFFEQCARRGDFYFFHLSGIILALTMLVVLGYRAKLKISSHGAIFWVTIWGLPLRMKKIMIDKIEEIRLTPSMRGPRVQIVSDEVIISFRFFDRQGARWLSYRLQQFMLENVDSDEGFDK
ncbi:MAG: hypothetical protein AB9903_10050 [Vulcanimicrobiota bacterium]